MERPLACLGWGMALFGGASSGESAAEAVERLGDSCGTARFNTSDVAHILLTHLDKDHTGGLADFPQATVHIHSDALAALRRVEERRAGLTLRERSALSHFAHGPGWAAFETTADSRPATGSFEMEPQPASDSAEETDSDIPALLCSVFPGTRTLPGLPDSILAVPLPGHAPGHCGYAINTDAGWLLHSGDSTYHRAWLDGGRPPLAIQLVEHLLQHDGRALRRSRYALRELAMNGKLRICSSHDPQAFAELCGRQSASWPR